METYDHLWQLASRTTDLSGGGGQAGGPYKASLRHRYQKELCSDLFQNCFTGQTMKYPACRAVYLQART